MNSQFQTLPQIEFPDNVKNPFILNVNLGLLFHMSFIWMSSFVYNLVPKVFMFNTGIVAFLGALCLVLTNYTPSCRGVLLIIYVFSQGYILAYTIPSIYLQYSCLSFMIPIMCIILYLKYKKDTYASYMSMWLVSMILSIVLNSCTFFIHDIPNILLIVVLDIGLSIHSSCTICYLKDSMTIFTPTQSLDAVVYILLYPLHFVKHFIFFIKSRLLYNNT